MSADPGVRAGGMGGAYTALGGEPMGLYWNPALAFHQTGRSLEASYTDLYGLGLARRTFLVFGTKTVLEVPRFDGDQMVVERDTRSGPGYAIGLESMSLDLDENSYSELSLGGAAAWGYGDRLALGLGLKALFVSSDLDDVSAVGYDLGLGVTWSQSEHERIGIGIPHLLSRVIWKFESTERLPLGVAVGWSRRFGATVVASTEAEFREGESTPYRVAAGGEWWAFPERLAVRGGFRHVAGGVEDVNEPTFGAGVRFSRLRFDYAFRMEPDALGDTHRFGLLVGF
jgi:hypothetical protein